MTTPASAPALDRVGLTLLHKQLVNVCDEMAVSMMRTAYSPIFSEGLDFSTLILDRHGNLVATAGLNPAMLGASLYAATWIIQEVGADNFDEGDVWIHNDPYRGGSHMPEHMMVTPVYLDGVIVAYVGNIAHMAEIGGMSPGSFAATATDIYQEGLRLPPVRLFRRGEPVQDIWRMMLSNHRTPANSWGDLHAMLGSLRIGERRLRQLFDERGVETLTAAFGHIQDFADTFLREEIRKLPDGVYYGEDTFDDDGIGDQPYAVRLAVIVDGDELIFDYSRSDQQAIGPINAPYVVTLSASLNGLLYVLGRNIPVNAGINRAIRVVAPAGTICCVKLPGACVGGQTEYQPRIMEMVMGTILGQILPERAAGASGNTSLNFLFGGTDPRTGDYYAHYHFEGNGWGGRATTDGNSAQVVPHANCRNTPVEIFETRWPWIHERLALDSDAGGPGHHRGGLGIERVMEVAGDVITVSALADRAKRAPWGIHGGSDGSTTKIELQRPGDPAFRSFQEHYGLVSPSKFANVRLRKGDRVRLVSPSGGGYGSPLERDPKDVATDVRDGFVTVASAERLYGVVIDEQGLVDVAATDPEPRVHDERGGGLMAWMELRKTWHDTDVDYCDVCGNLLIHRYWGFTGVDGAVLRACREDDERLYHRLREFAPRIEAARAATGSATTATVREPPLMAVPDEPRAPFAPAWTLDSLIAEGLAGLADGVSGDAQRIDGRALAVKASPLRDNSQYLVMGTATLPPGFSTRAHSHVAEEIAVVLRGSGHIDIEGVSHPVAAGSVLLTPSELVHVTHSDAGTEPLVILWFYAPPGSEARWVEPESHDTAGRAG